MDHSRRDFLKTAGCLTIGFSIAQLPFAGAIPLQELPGSLKRYSNIDAWLQVLADGSVRVFTGKLELGQGIRTAVAQVAAEELELPMEKVSVALAETEVTPNENYTAGSTSIETSAMSVRYAAAAARERLLELAGEQLKLPPEQLHLDNGKATTKNGDRSATFAQILNGHKLSGEIKPNTRLKPKKDYTISGTPVHRDDIPQIVKGAPVYVHDLHFPGMVHARIVRPPAYDAQLQHYNEQAVKAKIPGLLKVVANGSFLGVIATREYDAVQAQQLLSQHAEWSKGTPLAGSHNLAEHLASLPVKSEPCGRKDSQ